MSAQDSKDLEMTQAPPANRSASPPHILTLVLIAAASAVPMNILAASLPALTDHFETRYEFMQLTITGYLFMTGFVQLFAGPLSDRYGRRPVVLAALFVFVIASIGCTMTTNATAFLAMRGVQAVSATGIVLSRTIVRDMYGPARSASMIGYVTMGMALAPMVAPALGGILDEIFGWQANFIFLAGMGIVIFGIAWNDLTETNAHRSDSFLAQWRMYPTLMRSRRFWGYALVSALSSGTFFAYLSGGPLIGATVFELSPSKIGLFFAITPLGYIIGNGVSGRFATQIGPSRMIILGCTMLTISLAIALAVQLAGAEHPFAFYAFTVFVGLSNGMVLPSANVGMMSVNPELAGSASGLGGAMMTFFGAALSAAAVAAVVKFSSPSALLVCMFTTAFAALLVAIYTVRRESVVAIAE